MSDFNYPVQVDSSIFTPIPSDIIFNDIFNSIRNDSNISTILSKIKTELKLGIESKSINEAYLYVVLLDYFDALYLYYEKASDAEKSTFYIDYIACVEQSAICKSNPKLIRALGDLIQVVSPPIACGLTKINDNQVYLNSEGSVYKVTGINADLFSTQNCYRYNASTATADYFEKGVDLNPIDQKFYFDFIDKELFIIGTGIHNFYIDRFSTRTFYFIINNIPSKLNQGYRPPSGGIIGSDTIQLNVNATDFVVIGNDIDNINSPSFNTNTGITDNRIELRKIEIGYSGSGPSTMTVTRTYFYLGTNVERIV